MSREDRIINFIKTHRGCTKTLAENSTDMAEKTARTIIKKLIKDRIVICEIDAINPQVHHLYINDVALSRKKINDLIKSKVDAQMKNLMYTSTQLKTGEWISVPVSTQFSPNYLYLPSVSEIIDAQLDKKTNHNNSLILLLSLF